MTSLIAHLKATGKSLNSMQELLQEELNDLYSAEQQIIKSMPKMVEAASSSQVKSAFSSHLEQTKRQKERLEKIFRMLDIKPSSQTCEGMKGLLEECQIIIKTDGDPAVKDAALIACAQRVEHYEIAGYGAARTFAQHMGLQDVAAILQQTLDEEGKTDHELTSIAVSSINPKASTK